MLGLVEAGFRQVSSVDTTSNAIVANCTHERDHPLGVVASTDVDGLSLSDSTDVHSLGKSHHIIVVVRPGPLEDLSTSVDKHGIFISLFLGSSYELLADSHGHLGRHSATSHDNRELDVDV